MHPGTHFCRDQPESVNTLGTTVAFSMTFRSSCWNHPHRSWSSRAGRTSHWHSLHAGGGIPQSAIRPRQPEIYSGFRQRTDVGRVSVGGQASWCGMAACRQVISPKVNPPALPEDSQSLTIPGVVLRQVFVWLKSDLPPDYAIWSFVRDVRQTTFGRGGDGHGSVASNCRYRPE